MPPIRLLIASALGLWCALASAQQMWEWTVEENGVARRYMSDRPPPANLKNVKVLRSPGGTVATRSAQSPIAVPALAASGANAPPAKEIQANVPPLSTEDKELVAKKKQAADAEAAKVRAAEQVQAAARAEACTRAQAGKATYDSGERISITRPNGEREILDDAARAVEIKRIQGAISANCG